MKYWSARQYNNPIIYDSTGRLKKSENYPRRGIANSLSWEGLRRNQSYSIWSLDLETPQEEITVTKKKIFGSN